LDLAEKLHDIKEIIVIDHDKCGAYKFFYGPDITPEKERELHQENIQKFIE